MDIFKKLVKLENEASEFGFKWECVEQITQQIQSEMAEIDVHLKDHDREKLQEEIGDLFHAVFSLTLFCGFDPQQTFAHCATKFERRLTAVKALAQQQGLLTLNGQPFDVLMRLWEEAKRRQDDDLGSKMS